MGENPRCGYSGIQVQSEAQQVCLQDQESLRVQGGCSVDTVGPGLPNLCLPIITASTQSALLNSSGRNSVDSDHLAQEKMVL